MAVNEAAAGVSATAAAADTEARITVLSAEAATAAAVAAVAVSRLQEERDVARSDLDETLQQLSAAEAKCAASLADAALAEVGRLLMIGTRSTKDA